MDTYTMQRTGKSPLRHLIMAICGLVGALMLAGSVQASGIAFPRNRAETMPLPEVPEVNFTVKVTNPLCPQFTQSWSYSSVEDAVKDTIPGEWWDSAYTPDNTSLRSAAIVIRSVIKYWVTYPQNAGYAYSTAGVDWQGGESAPESCGGVLNTEWNAQRHSRPSYDSNGAANATVSDYVVDVTPVSPVLIKTNRSVEKSSVECAKNSGDYKFCALQALFGDWPNGSVATGIDPELSENRYARNISTAPSSPSGPLVEF